MGMVVTAMVHLPRPHPCPSPQHLLLLCQLLLLLMLLLLASIPLMMQQHHHQVRCSACLQQFQVAAAILQCQGSASWQ